MINLTKRHVFIAGGSRGIGRATALMAAKAGADVTINYVKDETAAQSLATEIKALGRQALCVKADLTKPQEVENAFDASATKLGPIHGLVISAGIFEGKAIKDMDLDFWNRTIQLNLNTTFLAVKAGARHMRPQKSGSIVIFTSTAGQRGSSVFSAYATSKGAQLLFMRSMAKELAPDRIRVNCVAPGWTETDMSRDAMDKEGREGIINSIPLGRIGRPEDPGAAALFLLSDLAQFITGSTITVDGGFDMRG
jgi:NAD(P)-dependent dehydrogenase (short-subunit alcohol dehydrogenase family)